MMIVIAVSCRFSITVIFNNDVICSLVGVYPPTAYM